MTGTALTPFGRELINEALREQITIVVAGFEYTCWRCEYAATPPVVLHDSRAERLTDWSDVVMAQQDITLEYVQQLLAHLRHPLARTIKVRRSKAARSSYLSHGCPHCDALFGAFPLGEEIPNVLYGEKPVVELARVDVPALEWLVVKAAQ